MDAFTFADSQIQTLRQQIESTESQLRSLKLQLQQAEQKAEAARHLSEAYQGGFPAEWLEETMVALNQNVTADIAQKVRQEGSFEGAPALENSAQARRWPLEDEEYKRYGRQMILPDIGLHGQLRLEKARVLIVGMGGLGCPAAAYLAAAGVGSLGLVDGDTVEVSNLHRQIAHSTAKVGQYKVDSAYEYLSSLNPTVNYMRYRTHLSAEHAIALFEQFDLVLDCTDHPTSRYLISDASVLTGKPLVSASALKTEGQLMILNNPSRPPGDTTGGPCYRCVFPKPPPAESVLSCGEGGILGPVVGVMGVLQALEAIKLLTAKPQPPTLSSMMMGADFNLEEPVRPTLLMFSAYNTPQFRSVRLRSRREDCTACSAKGIITRQSLTSGSLDYVAFCGVTAPFNILPAYGRITARDFAQLPRDGSNVLLDVRDETQYAICALRGSINVPWTGDADSWVEKAVQSGALVEDGRKMFVVCRLGNDSQVAVKAAWAGLDTHIARNVKDIKGGFKSWREEVDPSWPEY